MKSVPAQRPAFLSGWFRNVSVCCTLLWFIVRDFLRTPWTAFNVLAILALQLFMVPTNPTRSQYFSLVYTFMLALSALNTMGIFARANSTQTYPILARPITRTTYIVTTMVAAWLVSVGVYLVVTALAYLRYGPPLQPLAPSWFGFTTYLGASITVAVATTFAVSLMSLLAAFVSPFWVRLLVLTVITVLVMSFDPRTFPLPFLTPIVEHIPPILAPIIGAVRYATDSPHDSLARASVIILAAYTSTLLALVLWLSTRREIVLD